MRRTDNRWTAQVTGVQVRADSESGGEIKEYLEEQDGVHLTLWRCTEDLRKCLCACSGLVTTEDFGSQRLEKLKKNKEKGKS